MRIPYREQERNPAKYPNKRKNEKTKQPKQLTLLVELL